MSTWRVTGRVGRRAAAAALVLAALLAFAALPALAVTAGPQWTVTSVSRPTNFQPSDVKGDVAYVVNVTNTGGAASDGSPITITDELPAGLSLDASGAVGELVNPNRGTRVSPLRCVLRTCTFTGVVVPDETLLIRFPVDVSEERSSTVTNVVRVAGGGALDAAMRTPTTISPEAAKFGVSEGGATTSLSSTQAGAHPDITTSIAFNTIDAKGLLADHTKNTIDDLPPGFAGADLVDTPACPDPEFLQNTCPIGAQIGVTTLNLSGEIVTEPVYNLTPNPGEAAKIGFQVFGSVPIEGGIFLGGDYGPRAIFENVAQSIVELDSVTLTLWGVPADPVHDPLRFAGEINGGFGASSDAPRVPFFTNATSCGTEALDAVFTVSSWEEPSRELEARMPFGPMFGCERLAMEPSLSAEATTGLAYAPTGFDLNMTIPQTDNNPDGLATPNLNKAVVTLPEGMTVNPSAGAGLGACSQREFEEEAASEAPGRGCPNNSKLGTVKSQSPALKEEASGSVFLAQPAPLGEAGKNPFNSLLTLYIIARIPNRGVIVKAAGEVRADPLTGRLVTTFDTSDPRVPHRGLPPVPFTTFTFSFRQGATSPLVTPPLCGSYEVEAELTPWSDPGGAPLTPLIPPFPITNGFDGGPCPTGGVAPFGPQVAAGTLNPNAGSYSPLDIDITRNDGEQEITRFSSVLPLGLTANLSGIPFCSDASIEAAKGKTGAAEEAEPSCPAASQIGRTIVGAGVGSVLAQAPGKVYMARPYHGAPFSIVAITSAKVGPFDLGTVVVREALEINPETAVVTVDAKASDPIPHIIKGIVVHVRDIRVYIDRPNFTLNPTSCEPLTFSATVNGSGADFTSSADDVPVTVSDPFRVTACQALAFKPSFKVSTSGKTSKANGASLNVKLTYPNGLQGTQANIKYVKVDLPKQLPSRLTTLQKACPDSVFAANPAACPAPSIIGHATAITPILSVPLTGPAYFVSHGGARFPELIIVLEGYGVTIMLHGETFISKTGITSSTFNAVPDEPVTSFELTLPEGPYSALAANTNLCSITRTVLVRKKLAIRVKGHRRTVTRRVKRTLPASLVMPTAFTAQNGMVLKQNTKIAVTGCTKAKAHKKTRHAKRGAKNKKTRR